jgi:methyl acetate hydrolase
MTRPDPTTAAVDALLRAAVDSGAVPNAVVMAADADGVVSESAAGPRVAGEDDPVTPDSVFRVASMTKMVTTTAALQQWERGALDLAAPVAAYLPEFAELPVLEGFDGDTPRLRPPATQATVQQLLTHTAGLGYDFWNADVLRWQQLTGTPDITTGARAALSTPLVADPGTRFEYGTSTDWLGRVVEVVGGAPLDERLRVDVLEPLGMRDTAFALTAEQRARSVPVHRRRGDGPWAPSRIDWPTDPDFWAGGHALYSTPRDYLAFQRMLLAGGTLAGADLLRPSTVAAAFRDQLGGLRVPPLIRTASPASSCDFAPGPDCTWGWGLLLTTVDQPGRRAAGSGGWAGIDNTYFWVDPTRRLTGALYTQCLPFLEPACVQLLDDVERALYAAR